MAVILNNKKSTYGNPYCYYTLEYTSTTNRTTTSIDITFKVTSHLANSSSVFGTGGNRSLNAQVYVNGSWSSNQLLKSSTQSWSGTTEHTKTFTITINNLNSTDTTLSNVKFKVISGASDNACGLNSTACSDITIPIGHTPPSLTAYTMTEVSTSPVYNVVNDNVIVENLSVKQFTITYELFDSASIDRVGIYNNIYPYSTTTFTTSGNTVTFNLDCSQFNFVKDETDNTKIPIVARLIDNFDTMGTYPDVYTPDLYTYIPYTPPSIIESNIIVKRTYQVTGNAVLSLSGTYYNGSNLNQGGNYKPTLKYKVWEVGTDEPSTYENTISASSVTISDGTFSVSNYSMGNSFELDKSYKVKVQVNDTYKTTETSEPKTIPYGEALWTEFKDRVDFKKLTIQGNEILYKNILLAQPEQDLTLSTSNWTKINATQISNIGDKLYISNGGIKVGSGVTKVLVNANILFTTGGTSSTRRGVAIYKNDTLVVYNNIKGDTTYTGASIIPYLIDVQENDIIYMYGINQGGTGSIVSADYSYINVEAVE